MKNKVCTCISFIFLSKELCKSFEGSTSLEISSNSLEIPCRVSPERRERLRSRPSKDMVWMPQDSVQSLLNIGTGFKTNLKGSYKKFAVIV